MMNRNAHRISALTALAVGGLFLTGALTGCGGEEEPVVQERAAPAPPPPPPAPTVKSIEDLKAELRIDDRIILLEDKAPDTTEARIAVLNFFDAFARADERALRRMLSDLDAGELDRMVESGQWREATDGIEMIEIQTGNSPNGPAALALFDARDEFQVQLWYYGGSGDDIMFEAASTPPDMVNRLSGSDWIAAWHAILDEEMEIAMRPDVEVDEIQHVLDSGDGGSDSEDAAPPQRGVPTIPTPTRREREGPRRTPSPGTPGN